MFSSQSSEGLEEDNRVKWGAHWGITLSTQRLPTLSTLASKYISECRSFIPRILCCAGSLTPFSLRKSLPGAVAFIPHRPWGSHQAICCRSFCDVITDNHNAMPRVDSKNYILLIIPACMCVREGVPMYYGKRLWLPTEVRALSPRNWRYKWL